MYSCNSLSGKISLKNLTTSSVSSKLLESKSYPVDWVTIYYGKKGTNSSVFKLKIPLLNPISLMSVSTFL